MTKPAQDDLSRQRRINNGCCPTHGCELVQGELIVNKFGVPVDCAVECPRADCDYTIVPPKDSKCYKAIYSRQDERNSRDRR